MPCCFALLSTVLAAPTSTSARPGSFRPEIELDGIRAAVLVMPHVSAVRRMLKSGAVPMMRARAFRQS